MRIFKNITKKMWILIVLMAIFIYLDVYFELKMPDYTKNLTTMVQSGTTNLKLTINNGLLMLACALCSVFFQMLSHICISFAANGFEMNVRSELFNKITSFSQKEINKFSIASLITRTTNDVTQTNMFLSMGLQMLIKAPTMSIWAIMKISNSDIKWTYATMICVAVILLTVIGTAVICIPKFNIIQSLTDSLNNLTRENVSGVRVIRAFNAEEYQLAKFEKANEKTAKTMKFTSKVTGVIMPVMTIGMNCLTLAIYWIGALIINNINGEEALLLRAEVVGNMAAFSSYAIQVIISFMLLSVTFLLMPRVIVSFKRINEVLNTDLSIVDGEIQEGKQDGTVEFKNVYFSYAGEDNDTLSNISFKLEKGETLAIIGSTGSGKTTLINLIPRFYDVRSGEVLVDGINVQDYKQEDLENKIAFAFQKAALFKGSVLDNITYGSKVKDEDRVRKVLKDAQVEFVDDLDMEIAQGATNLSGGQKQRLSIARALYKDSEIIIFDDTLSALDYKTDMLVRKAIKENYKDKSVIIVAQRIGTIKNADKIIVLDEGEIVGMGTHDELLKNCEVYKEIALSQLSQEEL